MSVSDADQLITTRLDSQYLMADNHPWDKIIEEDARKFKDLHSKLDLISVIQKEYFLDIIIALTILSKTEHHGNLSRLHECDMFHQLQFLLFIFDQQRYFNLRPCENLQHIIQHCQMRNYISPVEAFFAIAHHRTRFS